MLAGTGAHSTADDASFNPTGSVLAVGDDDQSIYAFRGARVGNMTDFVREFKVRHQIKLEENYRSGSNILDTANELIGHNSKRLGKNPFAVVADELVGRVQNIAAATVVFF